MLAASNVAPIICFLFTPIARKKKKNRGGRERKRPDAFQVADTSGFDVDDAELAITPEKKNVLSPWRGVFAAGAPRVSRMFTGDQPASKSPPYRKATAVL